MTWQEIVMQDIVTEQWGGFEPVCAETGARMEVRWNGYYEMDYTNTVAGNRSP